MSHQTKFVGIGVALLSLAVSSCNRPNTSSNVVATGGEKTTKTKMLEAGAKILQNKEPLAALSMYLDGFHFYSGDMTGQMEAHHYCSKPNEDVTQCVIFDGNGKDAKIMGVEYIVSEALFKTLPDEEKTLWHSHLYEVKSGSLIAPGIPDPVEHTLMAELVSTYGKTWHTWHTDRHKSLPLGIPHSMMGFTQDGQMRPELLTERDKHFNISSDQKRQSRADIPDVSIAAGADAWERGSVVTLQRATAGGTTPSRR